MIFGKYVSYMPMYFGVLCLAVKVLTISCGVQQTADILVPLSVSSHVMTPVPSTLSYVMLSPNYAVKLFNMFQYFLPFQYYRYMLEKLPISQFSVRAWPAVLLPG